MYFFVIASSILIYKILRKNCDKPEYREKYPRFTNNLDSLSIYFNSLNNKNLESTIDFNNNYSTISDSESDSDTDIDTDLDTDSDSNSDIDTILDENKDDSKKQTELDTNLEENNDDSKKQTELDTNLEENKDDSKKKTELDTKLDENKDDKSTQIDEVQLSKEIIEKLVIKDNTKVNDETKLEESLLDEIITEEKSLSNSQIFKFKNNKILVGEDEENNVIINEL